MASAAAERYARALLNVAEERKESDKAQAALTALAQVAEHNAELAQVLADPRLRAHRLGVLTSVAEKFGAPVSLVSMLKVLNDADRLQDLPALARAFATLSDARAGRVRGEVTSAQDLGAAEQKALVDTLSRVVGKPVVATFKVDASLIGGVVAKVQDLIWDGSVRTQLERMRQALRGS